MDELEEFRGFLGPISKEYRDSTIPARLPGKSYPDVYGSAVPDIRTTNNIARFVGGAKRPSFEAIVSLAKALQASPAIFFQFDREENDEKVLRRKIEALLQWSGAQQPQQIYRVIRAFLEP